MIKEHVWLAAHTWRGFLIQALALLGVHITVRQDEVDEVNAQGHVEVCDCWARSHLCCLVVRIRTSEQLEQRAKGYR